MRQLAPVGGLLLLMSLVTMVNSSECTIGQELDPTEGRLRWIFSTPDPCSCSKVHTGGVNPRPVTRPYTPVFTDELLMSRDALRSHFKCPNESESEWTLKETLSHSETHVKTNLKKLSNWTDSDDTRKVRISLLRSGSPVVQLVFNVTGSVEGKWFLPQHLIESPQWPSLTSLTSNLRTYQLKWFKGAITVYENSPFSADCQDQTGWMAVIAQPWNECVWMYGWDAPIVMLYSLNSTPLTWTNIVTEIGVSARTASSLIPPTTDITDGSCPTCYISGWQENVWISLKLDTPAKVGIVKLTICPRFIEGKVACPPFPSTHKTDDDQCYHLSNASMSKTSADLYCKDLSGDRMAEWKVVEVDNENENLELISKFQHSLGADDTGIWLGYTQNNGDWLSDSDGTNQTYFKWPSIRIEPWDQACLSMDLGSSILGGYWQATACSSDRRAVCEYTGNFGKTFSSAHVLLGQSDDITQAAECGVPPSDDTDIHHYTCAEPRATASHVFVRKAKDFKDQLIICELNVYTVNDSLVGVADTMTFETSTENAGTVNE